MSLTTADASGSSAAAHNQHPGGVLLSADTIAGDDVCNLRDEKLGTIKDIMIDVDSGTIRYAVLASGGFLGMGDHLFAVPWDAFKLDRENKRFILDVDAERLKTAPSFEKDSWPDMADPSWNSTITSYYATRTGR